MRTLSILLAAAAMLGVAGCGGDDGTPATTGQPTRDAAMQDKDAGDAAMAEDGEDASMEDAGTKDRGEAAKPGRRGTRVIVGDSEFGEMLFSSRRQAIYIFENDPTGETVCYGECAAAWPPVFTDGRPVAGKGVDAGLLGTVRRRDGRLQVTYADQPLYYYANENPGEVLCHNVDLNGGLWWVVGPDGKRRP